MIARLKNCIENKTLRWHLKILFMIFAIVLVFSWYTFADVASCWDGNTAKDIFVNVLYNCLSFLSRWWILLANLAGKLMTNDMVYGTFLHLDGTLWTFWNVVKNIANFLLWFFVLFAILKNVLLWGTNSGDKKWSPFEVVKNTLIAWVLIQMSWFLVGLVLDISTICTAAIGSFPAQFLAIDDQFQMNVENTVKSVYNHTVIVDYSKDNWNFIRMETWSNTVDTGMINELLDTILPSTDSLSWPLIYIWMSVFDFRDFNIHMPDDCDSWWNLLLSVWLDGAVILAYSIMMFLLFIFNLMRVLILWIVIPMIPLIIVLKVFNFKLDVENKTLQSIINVWNILKLIFKPVLMVWALSIVLIVMVLVKWIINSDHSTSKLNIPEANLTMESKDDISSMEIDGLLDVNLSGYKDGFAWMIVYLLGLFLMYFVLKLSTLKTWIGFVDDTMSNIFKRAESLVTSAPIIPIPWWGAVSIDKISSTAQRRDILTKRMWLDVGEQDDLVSSWLWIDWALALRDNMSRNEFIEKARAVCKDYKDETDLKNKNNKLWNDMDAKIKSRNKVEGRSPNDFISFDDIFPKKEGTKT